jgi:hypothetical protein
MIAMANNTRPQKKTETELIGRRSSALACPSDAFWFFKSLHYFLTPNYQELLYHNSGHMSTVYQAFVDIGKDIFKIADIGLYIWVLWVVWAKYLVWALIFFGSGLDGGR